MNTITLLAPPRIVFGNGCAGGCAELLARRGGRRVLLVSSKSVLPRLGFLIDSLRKAGCEVTASSPVGPEPTLAAFERLLDEAKKCEFDAVIGAGGGSVLDAAKLIAALARGGQNVREAMGINLCQERKVFLVCLPTTAGTGSEVSPNSVLVDEAEEMKKAVISPHLVPDIALVDPLLTVSVPPGLTAATGMDALTHCLEAYANKCAHPIPDLHALEGIRLISANLLRAVRDGGDAEARAKVALGSLYGGLCLGPVNTAAVHALSNPLGGRFRLAHGLSNAVLLPHVVRFNAPAAPERYAEVARALGIADGDSVMATAELGVQRLAELSRECGIPQRLSDCGVPREAIPWMAKTAMQVTRLLKNNPRPVTEQDAVRIYEAAF